MPTTSCRCPGSLPFETSHCGFEAWPLGALRAGYTAGMVTACSFPDQSRLHQAAGSGLSLIGIGSFKPVEEREGGGGFENSVACYLMGPSHTAPGLTASGSQPETGPPYCGRQSPGRQRSHGLRLSIPSMSRIPCMSGWRNGCRRQTPLKSEA